LPRRSVAHSAKFIFGPTWEFRLTLQNKGIQYRRWLTVYSSLNVTIDTSWQCFISYLKTYLRYQDFSNLWLLLNDMLTDICHGGDYDVSPDHCDSYLFSECHFGKSVAMCVRSLRLLHNVFHILNHIIGFCFVFVWMYVWVLLS